MKHRTFSSLDALQTAAARPNCKPQNVLQGFLYKHHLLFHCAIVGPADIHDDNRKGRMANERWNHDNNDDHNENDGTAHSTDSTHCPL